MYKNLIIVLLFFVQSLSTSAETVETNSKANIAIVDVQFIFEHSLSVMSIRKSIDSISKDIQNEVVKKEYELKKTEENLLKKREILTEEEFDKEVTDFNKKVSRAQKDLQGKKLKLDQANGEAIQQVNTKIIEIISQLSKQYNFSLVLPSSQVLFAKDNLNITQEVLKKLDDKLKSVKVNYSQNSAN